MKLKNIAAAAGMVAVAGAAQAGLGRIDTSLPKGIVEGKTTGYISNVDAIISNRNGGLTEGRIQYEYTPSSRSPGLVIQFSRTSLGEENMGFFKCNAAEILDSHKKNMEYLAHHERSQAETGISDIRNAQEIVADTRAVAAACKVLPDYKFKNER